MSGAEVGIGSRGGMGAGIKMERGRGREREEEFGLEIRDLGELRNRFGGAVWKLEEPGGRG